MNKIKMISLAVVLMMVISAFGMIMPAASAQIVNKDDSRSIYIQGSSIDNYNPGPFSVKPIYPGSLNVNFNIRIDNDGGDAMSDDNPIIYANLSISTTLRDETGSSVTTPISNWDVNRVDDEATIGESNGHTFSGFQFDVKG
ncbi:MAG: hypothetical protein Q7J68_00205, partial [Thermoplasmata archaeon]|nr:hypothetical protein [Thermoplasmata archaeon]